MTIYKKLLLTLFLMCCFAEVFSQNINDVQAIDNEYYKQVNPEAWRFHEYSFSGIDLNKGKANVEIPLYEVKLGRISVPIKLFYNTRGIKVEEISSYVGAGWDLVSGGRITRRIMGGLMDLMDYTQFYNDSSQPLGNQGNIDDIDIDIAKVETLGYLKKGNFEYSESKHIDQAPDIFSCSAPGLSGRFLHNTSSEVIFLDSKNMKLEESIEEDMYFMSYNDGDLEFRHDEYDQFIITSEVGLQYTFSTNEIGANYTSNWTMDHNITSWFLDQIKDPLTGETINFDYEEVGSFVDERIDYEENETITGCGCNTNFFMNSKSAFFKVKRLSRIYWSEGYVDFKYEEARLDVEGDKALTSIQVYNSDDLLIKNFKLNYSYFNSPGGNSAIYKRIKLNNIREYNTNESEYNEFSFSYYPGELPYRRSKEQDLWGYFNDNDAISLLPRLYLYPNRAIPLGENKISNCFFPEKLSGSSLQYYTIAGADRSVNSSALKIGMLKDIKLPTGGMKTFDYEPNSIKIESSEISANGLRICSEKLLDGERSYVKTYVYDNGKSQTLPQMAHMCNSNSFPYGVVVGQSGDKLPSLQVKSHSFVNSIDINPYEVYYGDVKEIQEGNGFIQYNYKPLENYYSFVKWNVQQYGSSDYQCSYINKLFSNKHFVLPPRTALSGKPWYTMYFEEGNNIETKTVSYDYINSRKLIYSEDIKSVIGYMDKAIYVSMMKYCYSKVLLREKSVRIYGMEDKKTYSYDTGTDLLRSQTHELLPKEYEIVNYVYPFDLIDLRAPINTQNVDYLGFRSLIEKNVNIPIYSSKKWEKHDLQQEGWSDFSLTLYKNIGNRTLPYLSFISEIPKETEPYNLSFNSSGELNALKSNYFKKKNEIIAYLNSRPSVIYDHQSGVNSLILWNSTDLSKPNLVAVNVNPEDVVYESFENNGSYPPSDQFNGARVDGGYVGEYCLEPLPNNSWELMPRGLNPAKKYCLSFWAMGPGTAYIYKGKSINLNSTVWKYYSTNFTGKSELVLNFEMQGVVDEIKIYPVDGKMITRRGIPLIGPISETNENGITTYYEYDSFGRLEYVKDDDGNILKHHTYHYQNQ